MGARNIPNLVKRFRKDREGAVLVYVSVGMTVLIAMVGFAIDFARVQSLHSELQDAADAAALAAATQLDGNPGAQARATAAASGTALVSNTHGTSGSDPAVSIESINFYPTLPASDDDPLGATTDDDRLSEFVEVVTAPVAHTNLFLPLPGITKTRQMTATAVAGQEAQICRVTPLAICNPAERDGNTGAPFNVQDWTGTQIMVRMTGANSQWAPGNFGLLDTPDEGQSAPALAHMLAAVDGADKCFSTRLNTRPGQVASIRNALNTRFDMYGGPHFQNAANDPDYPPASNVTKGYIGNPPGNGGGGNGGGGQSTTTQLCNGNFSAPGAPTALGMPRDSNMVAPDNDVRFGNSEWDCESYWDVNHPSDPYPSGCTSAATVSRYSIYELENSASGNIPGPSTTGSAENGAPVCYSGSGTPTPERRLINFAVMNCVEHNVRGNETGVPAEAFVRAFMTEPAGEPTSSGNNNFAVYLEVVDVLEPGANNGPLREYVEIFR